MQPTFAIKGRPEGKWYVVDAKDKTLGRVATRVAAILRGKHRPDYTPSLDLGDAVVVINAEKVRLTGKKLTDKRLYRHSGYLGGLKSQPVGQLLKTHPERVFEHAVKGMLPGNRLGRRLYRKLHVYAGPEHPHAAQKPEPIDV